jgi:hypothetical protein
MDRKTDRGVLLSANPIGDYWSRVSPSMSMIVIGHSLLYKDKDGAVWCMMFIDLLDGSCFGDLNTWNTFQDQS